LAAFFASARTARAFFNLRLQRVRVHAARLECGDAKEFVSARW
jgi:hypothetical protein